MPSSNGPKIEVRSINVDNDLRIVFYELLLKDPYNRVHYELALVSTRRGLTVNVKKKPQST